jgi:deoxyribodipyrimidine photo-lyase
VRDGATRRAADRYLREIAWREFAYHLLFHHPQTTHQPLRDDFLDFPWRTSDDAMRAWSEGKTGYPMVDAGMRQLSSSGWMHNRVRMIVASFLTKDLLLSWQDGARWFWDTLVDADLASNTLGWQWAAGCGADAQPFFRIFNPVSQGLKFDPEGEYVRAWVPELAPFTGALAHTPWAAARSPGGTAPASGSTYPARIVEHATARRQALAAWEIIRD